MRKALAAFAALGLIVAGNVSAHAEDGVPGCADFQDLVSSSYAWTGDSGSLDLEILLAAPACPELTYELWVVRDVGFDPTADLLRSGSTIFDLDGPYEPKTAELISISPSIDDNILTYRIGNLDDNDPTLCVYSQSVQTTTTTDESDANGNGTTEDDQHKGNDGDNRDGSKFDWETTTSSTVLDRAPNAGCEAINLVWDSTVGTAGGSGGSSGYN